MVVGLSPTQGSQFFFEKIVLGKLRCVALPFCCAVVPLPFSASLGVIVHTLGVRYCPNIDLLMSDELSLSSSLTPAVTTPSLLTFDPTSSTI